MFFFSVLCAFVTTFLLLVLILRPQSKSFLALDHPNSRSLHTKPTLRSGGLGIMAGVIVCWILFNDFIPWLILLIFFICLSLIDDFKGLPAKFRLCVHLIISLIFLNFYLPEMTWFYKAVSVFGITWMVNLYNFMDGSDGLAGGMALFGFTAYSIVAYLAGDIQISILSASIAISSLVFLFFNFNPAKIFMGDVGSIPIGFLAASIGLIGYQQQLWPCWFPIIVFSPFIVDATLTLLKRLFKGEKIWQAHRSHYYQRLVQMGLGHRKTALLEYCLMAFMAASALLGLYHSAIVASLFVCWIAIYGLIIWIIDHKWRNFSA